MHSAPLQIKAPGTVLYDGYCGMCSASVRRFHRLLSHAGFSIRPSQDPEIQKLLPANIRFAPSEILVLSPRPAPAQPNLIGGVDACLYIASQFELLAPVIWIFKLPGIHWLADRFYKAIAKRRYQISRVCRLRPNLQKPIHSARSILL